MNEQSTQLKARLADVHNLNMAGALLDWDQQTYMPSGGVEARAEQRATLSKIAHQLLTNDETSKLLEQAEREQNRDETTTAFLRVARREFDHATKLPAELVEETSRVTSIAQEEWAKARAASDYAHFAPHLEKIVDINQRTAQALGYEEKLYDALLDQYEEGMTCAQLDPIFEQLKEASIPLIGRIAQQPGIDDSILARDYDGETQKAFAERVLDECGFDFNRGRQDLSVHPFCTNFGRDDVRITTRLNTNDLQSALFGSLHEMGHAMYEQGIAPDLDGNVLGGGVSLGVHESQSRLWENLVGRSRAFWKHNYRRLQETFPAQLNDVSEDDFYRAINKVEPSCIRVEADEVTYNLHIILRYEMENDLLEGRLSVADAPAAWNAKMQQYLGVTPPDDAHGILQDVHWSIGAMGYFPTYSLGNILSAQLWNRVLEDAPNLESQIARGDFSVLLPWLRENIHRHGKTYTPKQLVQRATGTSLDVAPYAKYLNDKFGAIYSL
ncbi:MAG TPA: carboxypeptidase M32 [Abditibacteriaceae bacterium]|nr:carboxypeptidase M32 [Abditibacteriaceae bacterium]